MESGTSEPENRPTDAESFSYDVFLGLNVELAKNISDPLAINILINNHRTRPTQSREPPAACLSNNCGETAAAIGSAFFMPIRCRMLPFWSSWASYSGRW